MKEAKTNIVALVGFTLLMLTIISGSSNAQKAISIYLDNEKPQTKFAFTELKKVLSERGKIVFQEFVKGSDIILFTENSVEVRTEFKKSFSNYNFQLKPEGFSIRKKSSGQIWVMAIDEAGLMYGIFELAEQVKLYGLAGIQNSDENPHMKKRGIKFNIPLDVRTPSYTDMSDAAQQNICEVWSFDFWKRMIDRLSKNRYNIISLWSLHPFPSMIKLLDYPEIALDDVKKSNAKFLEYYSTRATGYDNSEIMRDTETIKRISIDEKIEFWKSVMRYGKERNIDFYFITWNIYTYGTDGKYGITDDMNNETTKDYFRKSVKQMFLTYPDLAGIGLTTGENMGSGKEGFEEKENWAFETFGKGVLDAVNEQPERKITFIHRQHEAATKYIAQKFEPLIQNKNVEFLFSFKYAKAHVFSSVKQSFHKEFVKDVNTLKTFWTLRNDDNYYFRWGAPDFVRDFIKNIPADVSQGFYYGSDGFVWGKEFLNKDNVAPRKLEIEKHWYHWMLWGRLGYNPKLLNERFRKIIQNHFAEADAGKLFSAWQSASMIYPITTGFHWGALDYQWYIEGCKSRPEPAQTKTGFHDVNRFINLKPHEESGYQSIPDYVKMLIEKKTSQLISPIEVSKTLHIHADSALIIAKTLKTRGNKELQNTVSDIISMAYLGKYYAFKINGAANLALFRQTGDADFQIEAVNQLTNALNYWEKYINSAMKLYKNPIWTNRVGIVDWIKLTEEVKNDISIAEMKELK